MYNSLCKNHNIPEMSLFPSSGGEEKFLLCGSLVKATLTPITEFCGFCIKNYLFGYDSCWPCWYVACSNKLTYSISFQVGIEYDSFKIKMNCEFEYHMTPFHFDR